MNILFLIDNYPVTSVGILYLIMIGIIHTVKEIRWWM